MTILQKQQYRPKRSQLNDKDLVAEQSGMLWLGIGLVISFVLGFTIRAMITPQKIHRLVSQSATQIHKEVRVKFDSAELSLSDGPWPRLAVVIKNITMISENNCWMKPQLEIDELELPVSLMGLLRQTSAFSTIEAQNVKLTLFAEKRDCAPVALNPVIPPQVAFTQAVTLVENKITQTSVTPTLDRVSIQSFEVVPVFYPQARTELTDVDLVLKSHQPPIFVLIAKSNVLKDPQWGEYSAHAQISVEYSEFPEKSIEAHIFGNWREGSYSWHTSYKSTEGVFETAAELRHIPLSKLASLSKNTSLSRFENMKKVWISLKSTASGNIHSWEKTPVAVKEFKIEGDSGDLQIDKLQWEKLSDPFPKPFLIQIRGLELQTLLKIASPTQASPLLNEMGSFTGRAEVDDRNNLKVIGELDGLQFVFSNKGQREYQALRRMSVEVNRKQGNWNLNISRLEPEQGVFNGELSATGDRDLRHVNVKLIAEEMRLAPAVQRLMSGGGSLGSFQSRINLGFKDAVLNKLSGKFSAQDLDIENLKIPNLSLQFQSDGEDGFVSQLQMSELIVPTQFIDASFLSPLKSLLNESDGNYELKQFKSQVKLKNFKSIKWKQFSFNFAKGSALGQAEWSEEGTLLGQLSVKSNGNHKYIIEGTRDKPILRLENDRIKSSEVSSF